MIDLVKAALEYKRAGLSIIGVKDNKQSLHYWKKYQYEIMPDELLVKIFNHPLVKGIAVVCGSISGNLEVIDMDSKYDLSGTLFNRYCEKLYKSSPELYTMLPIAKTKNNGYHFFYRCREIGNYSTLAKRPCTKTEKLNNPDEKIKVLIEVKAKGGYVIVPPTKGYWFIQHDIKNTPLIENTEKQLLYTIAKSFNEYSAPKPERICFSPAIYDPLSPFSDYDFRGDVIELLKRHGWKIVKTTPAKTDFRRPGFTDHDKSGDYNHQLGLFGVFSPNTDFEVGKGYRPYQVYAILECGCDFKLAAKKLLKEGYGVPYKKRR